MSACLTVVSLVVSTTSPPSVDLVAEAQTNRFATALGARAIGRVGVAESFDVSAQFGAAALAQNGMPVLDVGAGLQWQLVAAARRSLAVSIAALFTWAGAWPTWGASALGRVTGTQQVGERLSVALSVLGGVLYDAAVLRYQPDVPLPLGGKAIVLLAPYGGIEAVARFSVTPSMALMAAGELRVLPVYGTAVPVAGASFGAELHW